jgi:hypothetical protein
MIEQMAGVRNPDISVRNIRKQNRARKKAQAHQVRVAKRRVGTPSRLCRMTNLSQWWKA